MVQRSNILAGVRAVYFDAVGTLLFPAEPVATTYRACARRHAADIDEATIHDRFVAAFRYEDEIDAAAKWATSEERERRRWRTIVGHVLREVDDPDRCFAELWDHFRRPSAWAPNADSKSVIDHLSGQGIAVGIQSNFDARLQDIVAGIPVLRGLADRCVISSLVGWRKPAGEFFRAVVNESKCRPDQILIVGDDARNDYHGAAAAGLRPILLTTRGISETDRLARLSELTES